MYYAQFYHVGPTGSLEEGLGSFAIVILDGRLSPVHMGEIARDTAAKRGYAGYSIHVGETFARSRKVSGPWSIPTKVDETASSASYGA